MVRMMIPSEMMRRLEAKKAERLVNIRKGW